MNPDRRDFVTLGIGALAVAVIPAALRSEPKLIRRRAPVMGTVAEIAVRHRDGAWAYRAIDAALDELRRVERIMTRFRPDSDVGRVNATGLTWAPLQDDTGEVLATALRWASISEGRFDPCLGRAAELWSVSSRARPPATPEVRDLAGLGLWTALELRQAGRVHWARLTDPMAAVDLGGIAKGYGVDAAAEALRRHGVFHGLVNVGGDLVALGHDRGDEPWRVGVRSPFAPDEIVEVLSVSDAAVATSGDYLHFFQHGGRRYHHLLDPSTGAPRRTAMRSLTVRADRCVDADAAATAVYGAPAEVIGAILARAEAPVRVIHQIEEVTS